MIVKKGWTTTQLIAAGALGVLTLIMTLPGFLISNVTGIPGSSYPISGIAASMMAVVIVFLFKKFWAATISMTVLGFLAIPLPLAGTPGFLPKVLTFTAAGLIIDATYRALRNESKVSAAILGAVALFFQGIAALGIYILMLPQLAAFYIPVVHIMIALAIVMGALGGLLGRFVYLKISKTAVVKRIQGS